MQWVTDRDICQKNSFETFSAFAFLAFASKLTGRKTIFEPRKNKNEF
jgi:hypothetical protein